MKVTWLVVLMILMLMVLPTDRAQMQPVGLEVWYAVPQEDLDAVELVASLAEEAGFKLVLTQVLPIADLPTRLATASAAGTPPDIIITDHIMGARLLATGQLNVYCQPGGCPVCQSPAPPPWCPYARGNFSARIGGEMLDATQAWMSVDVGNNITPYGVPLWWNYFPPKDFAGKIQLPIVVYGAYIPPNAHNLAVALDLLLWAIEKNEVATALNEQTRHLPVSKEAGALLLDELVGLERVNSFPVPFLILPSHCIDFEDLTVGTSFNVGDIITSAGFDIEARDFQWPNGTWHSGGFSQVDNNGLAGGSGNDMEVNNISLGFPVLKNLENIFQEQRLPTAVSLRFGEYGGNLNLDVNGDFANFEDFADVNGSQLGNVAVLAVNGFGNDKGFLVLTGQIEVALVETFTVGGQELWIDDVCIQTYP